jgi:hypothetical protein
MGKKINDTGEFPNTTPAAADFVLGVDVSNTSNDANGEVVTFLFSAIPLSILNNDSGFITSYTVTEGDVTAHQSALSITQSQISDLGAYITDLLSDTTPQLGGNLDVNGNKIVSTSDGDIDIEPNGTGNVLLGNLTFDADQTVGAGQDDYVLTYDHAAGTIALEGAGGGGGGLVPISKTTAANDSAIDISLTGGYSKYRIILENVYGTTDDREILLRVSIDSGATFKAGASDYEYRGGLFGNIGSTSTTTNVTVAFGVGFDGHQGATGYIDIFLANGSTTHNRFMGLVLSREGAQATDPFFHWHFGGEYEGTSNTTAATDIRFLMSSGNVSVGNFHLYGIADGA